ncbi:MAG: LamG-like jellyroll fold domain-containing protein [Thermoanaerobaculia bacterium]
MLRRCSGPYSGRLWPALLLAVAAVGACEQAATLDPVSPEAGVSPGGQPTQIGDPDLVDGFIVWESNRSGDWRIWTRTLSEPGASQLTSDEETRQHCCPHISPDGRWVAYLSLARVDGYAAGGSGGELRIIRSDGSAERLLAPRARSLFENRAAVWRSATELIFIRGDLGTMLLDIGDLSRRELTRPTGEGKRAWLVNGSLSHAVTGEVDFSPYDPASRAVAQRNRLSGCQPYFSHDGRWGLWTAGTGGPVKRIDLASGAVSTILEKSDPRIPDGLGYVYFPMVSADGRLFSFAASNHEHHHFEADYEVFVAETDPETLEIEGNAVRMTHHPATDRFPDAYLARLDLGRHRGEAPLEVRFEPASDSEAVSSRWLFDFGDGSSTRAASPTHSYANPGRYTVTATLDGESGGPILRGHVTVLPAQPPTPTAVSLEDQGRLVLVRFDEDIRTESPRIRFESGFSVESWSVGADGRTLIIEPAERVRTFDRITLAGIGDRAQRANWMESTTLEIDPPLWPSNRSDLVFLWQAGNEPNLVFDRSLGSERACLVEPAGQARLDHNHAIALGRGSFVASPADSDYVLDRCTATNRCSLEATVRAEAISGDELRPVVAFSGGSPRSRNFLLAQRGGRLVFGPRAGNRGARSVPEVDLGPIGSDDTVHVVVSYEPGRLIAVVNGMKVAEESLAGGFFHWRRRPLTLGAAAALGSAWAGSLEGVAIYSRMVEAPEARENYLRYREMIEARPEVDRFEVDGALVARSETPSLEEISPYREALAVFEYEVEGNSEGRSAGDRLRVAHWVILNGEVLEVGRAETGADLRLTLEPFAANPQLEGAYLADTLPPATGPLYYAVSP